MEAKKQKHVLVIGLDGATWKVINPLLKKHKLPTLGKLIQQGSSGISTSTLPPLTPSVWTSFLTGVNPGKHGIFGFLNYRSTRKAKTFFTNENIAYWTIDEYLKKLKYSSYISYTDLDGLIQEAGVETETVKVEDLLTKARAKIASYINAHKHGKRFSFSFILFKEVDVAQHLYWNKPQVEDFYINLDSLLGELISFYKKKYGSSADILVISDHGFHAAAQVQFSIYPWLKKMDHIHLPINFSWELVHSVNKLLKKVGINLMSIKGIQKFRNQFVAKKETITVNQVSQSRHLLPTFEGLYVFTSQIELTELVTQLQNLKHGKKKVFKGVWLAREIYKGAHSESGPNIVWQPNEGMHINVSPLETKVFSNRPTNIPGDHVSDEEGIYIISKKNFPKKLNIYDFTAVIYDLLQVAAPVGLDGMSPLATYLHLDRKIKVAQKLMLKALRTYGQNMGIAFTGRKDSTVMVHLLRNMCKETNLAMPPIMFIDHGHHFPESISFLKLILKKWQLKAQWIKTNTSKKSLAEKKIAAMERAIAENNWQALMTAIRKDESAARSTETHISTRSSHMRIHPMLDFTEKDIWDYLKRFNVSYNPLYDQGYRSLEEKGATKKVTNYRFSERSGRDKGKEKTMANLRRLGYF